MNFAYMVGVSVFLFKRLTDKNLIAAAVYDMRHYKCYKWYGAGFFVPCLATEQDVRVTINWNTSLSTFVFVVFAQKNHLLSLPKIKRKSEGDRENKSCTI